MLPSGDHVGTALSAAEVNEKPDGTVTRTLWGEMAWQLGGVEGYEMVAESDAQSISPGSEVLARLFKKYSPCLILIDEWVAYFRGIYSVPDTAAGSFETNLTFAQALTESAKLANNCLMDVIIRNSFNELNVNFDKIRLQRDLIQKLRSDIGNIIDGKLVP